LDFPQRFGDYELLDCFARGGMGELFCARHVGIDGYERRVCIKRISAAHLGKPLFETMFVAEARITAQLSHQNIPHLYRYDRIDGYPFMAMEYVDGPDLGQTMARARELGIEVPLPVVIAVADGLAGALGHAHQRRGLDGVPMRLVHRDVSPHNVVLSREGEVKLVDFGLACAWLGGRLLTPPGKFDGNHAYRAPEQLIDPMVDPRADVFSLGTLLYELVAGEPCFAGNDEEEIMARVTTHQPDMAAARKDLPKALVQLLERCLRKDPDERYPSIAAMEPDLEAAARACGYFGGRAPLQRFLETVAGSEGGA
jgi:serine/threonine protein kinase